MGRSDQDYKFKIVSLTSSGIEILKQLSKSPDIQSKIRERQL